MYQFCVKNDICRPFLVYLYLSTLEGPEFELCSAPLPHAAQFRGTKTASLNGTPGCSWSFTFDKDNDSCQATKIQLPLCENFTATKSVPSLWLPVAKMGGDDQFLFLFYFKFFAFDEIYLNNIFSDTGILIKSQIPAALSFLIQQTCQNECHGCSNVKR